MKKDTYRRSLLSTLPQGGSLCVELTQIAEDETIMWTDPSEIGEYDNEYRVIDGDGRKVPPHEYPVYWDFLNETEGAKLPMLGSTLSS